MRMQNRLILALLLTAATACGTFSLPMPRTAAPTSSTDPTLLHFDNQWVAFDYPRGLNVHAAGDAAYKVHPSVDVGGELVVGLGDPKYYGGNTYYHWIRISRRVVCSCDSLQKVMDQTYQAMDAKSPLAASMFRAPDTVSVGGLAATQKAYRIYWGEPAYDLRDIWVRQGENVFIISISMRWSNSEDLSAFEAMADRIVEGLIIKGQ